MYKIIKVTRKLQRITGHPYTRIAIQYIQNKNIPNLSVTIYSLLFWKDHKNKLDEWRFETN